MDNPLHILVVDDEILVALGIADFLEGKGYRVTVAHNGRQALYAEEVDAPDLLLTDMHMPEIGGHDLLAIIRERRPRLPIIVMTAYSDELPAEEPGRLVLLSKPLSMIGLHRVIRSLTANPSGVPCICCGRPILTGERQWLHASEGHPWHYACAELSHLVEPAPAKYSHLALAQMAPVAWGTPNQPSGA